MESIFSKPIIASLRYLVDAELERAMNRGEDTPSVLGLEGDDRMSRAVLVRRLREVHRLTAARRRARSAATSVQARRKRPSAARSSTWLSLLVASACPSVASRAQYKSLSKRAAILHRFVGDRRMVGVIYTLVCDALPKRFVLRSTEVIRSAVAGLWSLPLPSGLALLAFAMGLPEKPPL
jgi:hypothetical protein